LSKELNYLFISSSTSATWSGLRGRRLPASQEREQIRFCDSPSWPAAWSRSNIGSDQFPPLDPNEDRISLGEAKTVSDIGWGQVRVHSKSRKASKLSVDHHYPAVVEQSFLAINPDRLVREGLQPGGFGPRRSGQLLPGC
jgi:hypothetical protein